MKMFYLFFFVITPEIEKDKIIHNSLDERMKLYSLLEKKRRNTNHKRVKKQNIKLELKKNIKHNELKTFDLKNITLYLNKTLYIEDGVLKIEINETDV